MLINPPHPERLVAAQFHDLPGVHVTLVDDMFTDDVAVRVTQDLGGPDRILAGFVPVPGAVVDSAGWLTVARMIGARLGPLFRPWLAPDPCPYPPVDLFPRWTRLATWRPRRRQASITRRIFT